jgi:hypothetical protein
MAVNGTSSPIPKGVVCKLRGREGDQRVGRAIGAKGTYFEIELYDCHAYRHLRPSAVKVLLGFKMRVQVSNRGSKSNQDWQPQNQRELVYTYDAIGHETGLGTQAISKALDDLVEKGFLDVVRLGGGRYGVHTEWGLSDHYKKWHPDPSKREQNDFVEKKRVRAKGHRGFENRTGN